MTTRTDCWRAMTHLASTHNAPDSVCTGGITMRTECWHSRYEDAPYHVVVIQPSSAEPGDGLCRVVTLEGEDLGWYQGGCDFENDDEAANEFGRSVIDAINTIAKGLVKS